MKPIVCTTKNRPVNDNFRNEHKLNQAGQHDEFDRVAEFIQRVIYPQSKHEQKRNQRAERQPAGRKVGVFRRYG